MASLSLIAENYDKRDSRKGNDRDPFLKWDVESGKQETIAFLKQTSLFKGLTRQQYLALSQICCERLIPQYDIIFRQGDCSDSLFLLQKGAVKIYKDEQFLSDLSAPDVFGEVGFFYGSARQYSVISADLTTVIEMNKKKLMRLVTGDNLLLYSIHLNTIDEFSRHQKKYAKIIAGESRPK